MGTKHKVTTYSKPHTSKNDSKEHVTVQRFERNKAVEKRHVYEGEDEYKAGKNLGNAYNNSRVICTYFYKKDMLSTDLWRADMEYTRKYISEQTIRGYHFWAIPYVKWMNRSKLAESFILPLAKWRAEEISFKLGERSKPNYKGKIIRLIGEPICWIIGLFVSEQNWEILWKQA